MFSIDPLLLNSEQIAAIQNDGSVLLTACPGSGKTRTVAYKIAYELSRMDSGRKSIIAITYTNTAADEIKERIELLGVDTNQLWIGTIHSFCLEWILRPYSLYIEDLKYGFKIMNSHDVEDAISDLCETYQPSITYWDLSYVATINGIESLNEDPAKQKAIEDVLYRYQAILTANRQIDFEWVLYYSYQILEENPAICKTLSNLFPWILVDEYQDTKAIQYQILAKILNSGNGKTKLFMVGDPNQSIFSSLWGYPMPKEELEDTTWLSLSHLALSKNYRSSTVIIDYFSNFATFPVQISAEWENKDCPSIVSYNENIDANELCDEIARLIAYNITNGTSPNEICVLGPWWIHLGTIARTLMVKLPDYSFNWPWMSPISRDIENFWFKVARIALTEPSPNMYIRRCRWAKEILSELSRIWFDAKALQAKRLLQIFNSIRSDKVNGLEYLEDFFLRVCVELNIEISAFPELSEHYESFFSSARARIDKLSDENPIIGNIESFRKVFKERDGITVSTMHWAKGTEYEVVIAFWLIEWIVPHYMDDNGADSAKKMLYVIASRAKKNLHLISEIRLDRWQRKRPPTIVLKNNQYSYWSIPDNQPDE